MLAMKATYVRISIIILFLVFLNKSIITPIGENTSISNPFNNVGKNLCKNNPFDKELQADILGIYGQNGSGKTTVLEALNLAISLMRGEEIKAEKYAGLISQGSENARMEIVFQFTNLDESVYHVEYAFSIAYRDLSVDKNIRKARNEMAHANSDVATKAVMSLLFPTISTIMHVADKMSPFVIADEVLSLSGSFHGTDYRFAPIFDTR